MKLATLKDGSRDGQLVVVSRDLASAHFATGIATRLQQVLDDWNFLSPQLEDLQATLEGGKARHAFAFDPRQAMAPLPRACQFAVAAPDAAEAAGEGAAAQAAPELQQRAGDALLGPTDDAVCAEDASGLRCRAALAAVTGDVDAGATPEAALEGVRLLMLAADWAWPQDPAAHPAAAFGPVAVTPDELGDLWSGGAAPGTLAMHVDGVARALQAAAPALRFGRLVAWLASARRVRAGTIVAACATPVGGQDDAAAALHPGQRLRVEWVGGAGTAGIGGAGGVFGVIEQRVASRR
jgi:fumarylacetoacetate (FAA) hydrolase